MTTVTDEATIARLGELGTLLRSCRTVFMTMFEGGFYEPSTAKPSEARADFRTIHMDPKGMWSNDFNKQPRSAAVKLLHQQSDYCHALGVLVAAPEVRDPIATLVRSVVEYGCRGFWLLDSSADHRVRCIRAFLLELASLYYALPSYKLVPANQRDAAKAASSARYKAAKARAAELFQPDGTNLADDPSRWNVEGHSYASWTTITQAWAEAHDLRFDGSALFEPLAVGAHPQGFTATTGLTFGTDGHGTRVFALDQVEKQVRLAIASFYYALTLVANYHQQRQPALVAWEETVMATLPGMVQEK